MAHTTNKNNKKAKTTKACIAIPTYNENKNIKQLITELQNSFKKIPNWQFKILIIDDNSPDNTAETVKIMQEKYKNLYIISGEKKGLGNAYTRGFTYILNNFNVDYTFQMDADLQHDPKDIKRFVKKAENGFDFIIGSRYVAGGDYPNWSFKRKIYSWGANTLAKTIAGIRNVEDCTSGFRCIKTSFLKSFNLSILKTNGYAFQLSLLHAAYKKQLKITEIPILFPNRKKGESKLGQKDIREFFITAILLRFKRY